MSDYKDLRVWQESMEFVHDVYKATQSFPKDEIYGLTNQIRRAAVSIPSNIAEGASRSSQKDFVRFLHIALGSASEIETQILIAARLLYLSNPDNLLTRVTVIRKSINALIRSLRQPSTLHHQP
jgi:four helix bundle protein